MTRKRIENLDVARRWLFEASEGLIKAGQVLSDNGLEVDGRPASRMGREVESMRVRVRVRKIHEDALAVWRRDNPGWGR